MEGLILSLPPQSHGQFQGKRFSLRPLRDLGRKPGHDQRQGYLIGIENIPMLWNIQDAQCDPVIAPTANNGIAAL